VNIALRYHGRMRWLVDGYNVIRRSPELASSEHRGLEAGRAALCELLAAAMRATGDEFTVVFDGARGGGTARGAGGVRVVFSSARESADRVLARMARQGGAVVSNDREVREAAVRAGAISVSADDFLTRIEAGICRRPPGGTDAAAMSGKDESDDPPRGPRKGNPRRLGKKARAAARALGRLAPGGGCFS
jgi:predicted RNA-binding protein with PIN domain